MLWCEQSDFTKSTKSIPRHLSPAYNCPAISCWWKSTVTTKDKISTLWDTAAEYIICTRLHRTHIHAHIKRCCISFLPPPLPFFFHVGSAIGTAQQADGMKRNDVYSFIAYNCQRCCWEANGRDKRTNDQVLQGAKQIIGNIRIVGCFCVFLTRYKKWGTGEHFDTHIEEGATDRGDEEIVTILHALWQSYILRVIETEWVNILITTAIKANNSGNGEYFYGRTYSGKHKRKKIVRQTMRVVMTSETDNFATTIYLYNMGVSTEELKSIMLSIDASVRLYVY